MNTEQLYYKDPALDAFDAEIVAIENLRDNMYAVELDQTAFYPEGGGQPSDQGTLDGPNGSLAVKLVRSQNGTIIHEGKMTGDMEAGDAVHGAVKWSRRLKFMRVHTAGHLLHDVLVSMAPDLVAVKGKHGDKAFLEYRGEIDEELMGRLTDGVSAAIDADLSVRSWESSLEELESLCESLPSNLPQGKALRAIQIGDFAPMPDGGVHVASTGEIGEVVVHHVKVENGGSTIRYGVK